MLYEYNSDSWRELGTRIHVSGMSCAGKSTLGEQLANALGIPNVELDALNWEPNWVGLNATNPSELERRMRDATAGDAWVVSGSYNDFSQRAFWPRVQTVIWLDLPMPTLLVRLFRRSWRRWRSKELLWGTNYEHFWEHFAVWRKDDSLLWWIVTQYARSRRAMHARAADPRWAHIRFIRLSSGAQAAALAATVQR